MLDFVPPQGIRALWPAIRERLDRLHKVSSADWLPEDVYLACMTGKATLHTITEAGEMTGFVVLEQTQEFGTPTLHVWVMWHDGQAGEDLYRAVLDRLKAYGRAARASRLRFSTHRKGWARRLERYGWKPTLQFLEIEL